MRVRLLALAPVFFSCAPGDVLPMEAADLETFTFSGEFQDSESCSPGLVDFELAESADGQWTGTYRFESVGSTTSGDVALYEVEGEIGDDGLLHMEQVDIMDADERDGWDWCRGEMSLALVADGPEPMLLGDWYAKDCSCAGSLTFFGEEEPEAVEAPVFQEPHLTW